MMYGLSPDSPGASTSQLGELGTPIFRGAWCTLARTALGVAMLFSFGCAGESGPVPPQPAPVRSVAPVIDVEIYRRAEADRAARLAREVERLKDDLRQAEEALVMAESGLRGSHSRADAVSRLAEVRIQVERAAKAAPWRPHTILEAQRKIEEATRQVQAGHFGAALFFVYRAERIASNLETEADQVYGDPGTRFIRLEHVNLRSGPSTANRVLAVLSVGTPVFPESHGHGWVLVRTANGTLGWIHASLLATQMGSVSGSAATTQSRPADLAR
jgi:hypothetical protein